MSENTLYTFHGPLSLRGWTIGKEKGEDRKKIHTWKISRRKKFIQPEQAEKHTYKLRRRNNMHTRQTKKKKIIRRVELTSLHPSLVFSNGRFLRRNLWLTIDGFVYTSAIWLDVSLSSLQLKKVSLHMMMSTSLCYLQRCFVELCQNENTFHQRSGKFGTWFSIGTICVVVVSLGYISHYPK